MDFKTSGDLVSIVIPCYNRKNLLLLLLKSLQQQSYRSIEIIVIDDYSTENIKEAVNSIFPDVSVIRCRRRFGPAFTKNLGILRAKGRYLLFLDSDTEIIHNNMIGYMVNVFRANNTLGQIGGERYQLGHMVYASGENISFDGKTVSKIVPFSQEENNSFSSCDYITTSNCFLEKKTIVELGGFDPYYIYPSEDKDLGFRLKKEGYVNGFCSRIVAHHALSDVASCKTGYFDLQRAKIRFVLKHKGLGMIFWVPLFDLIRLILTASSEIFHKVEDVYAYLKLGRIFRKRDSSLFISRRLHQQSFIFFPYVNAWLYNLKMIKNIFLSRRENFLTPLKIQKFSLFAKNNKLFRKETFR